MYLNLFVDFALLWFIVYGDFCSWFIIFTLLLLFGDVDIFDIGSFDDEDNDIFPIIFDFGFFIYFLIIFIILFFFLFDII